MWLIETLEIYIDWTITRNASLMNRWAVIPYVLYRTFEQLACVGYLFKVKQKSTKNQGWLFYITVKQEHKVLQLQFV